MIALLLMKSDLEKRKIKTSQHEDVEMERQNRRLVGGNDVDFFDQTLGTEVFNLLIDVGLYVVQLQPPIL